MTEKLHYFTCNWKTEDTSFLLSPVLFLIFSLFSLLSSFFHDTPLIFLLSSPPFPFFHLMSSNNVSHSFNNFLVFPLYPPLFLSCSLFFQYFDFVIANSLSFPILFFHSLFIFHLCCPYLFPPILSYFLSFSFPHFLHSFTHFLFSPQIFYDLK